MGNPLSWTGRAMRANVVQIAGGLERIEERIHMVLSNAGNYKDRDFIEILGDILADTKKSKIGAMNAFDIMKLVNPMSRDDRLAILKAEVNFLQQIIDEMENEQKE